MKIKDIRRVLREHAEENDLGELLDNVAREVNKEARLDGDWSVREILYQIVLIYESRVGEKVITEAKLWRR